MALDKNHLESLRWLYDDEETYRKAVLKLIKDDQRAEKQKAFERARRRKQIEIFVRRQYKALLALLRQKLALISQKRRQVGYGIIGFVFLFAIFTGSRALLRRFKPGNDVAQTGTLGEASTAPDFTPILPAGKQNQIKPNFSPQEKVFTYADNHNGSNLVVSQQKLPGNIAVGDGVASLAQSLGATTVIQTTRGNAYLKDSDTGEQIVVMSFNDLLIFVRTATPLTIIDWMDYAESLTLPSS